MSEAKTPSKSEKAKPPKPPSHSDESVKETFESIVIAFILAFVFRSYVVEAFVIPTGSMAPTLLGEHIHAQCESCGYIFNFDPHPESRSGNVIGNVSSGLSEEFGHEYVRGLVTSCPMCHYPYVAKPGRKVVAGDRILVQKYLYDVPGMGPRRWDVVVFKAPQKPEENYIKRLVGLPNEAIQIIDGNVFVAPLKADNTIDHSAWRMARKVDAAENPHADTIQRAVWQPVYHSQYIPQDIVDATDGFNLPARRGFEFGWKMPWVAVEGHWQGVAKEDETHEGTNLSRIYRFDGDGTGKIAFKFERAVNTGQWLYPYNAVRPEVAYQTHLTRRIEDLRIAATIRPSGKNCSVALTTQARVPDEDGKVLLTTLRGEFAADGKIRLTADYASQRVVLVEQTNAQSLLSRDQPNDLEIWFVDQELSLWLNAKRVATHRFNPTVAAALSAPPMASPPDVSIEVAGCPATLSNVEVDRDIFYTVQDVRDLILNRSSPGRGVVERIDGSPQVANPFRIYANQFFCMGDNSPNSTDSRSWLPREPSDVRNWHWVKQRKFQNPPNQAQDGVVPRRLMMGRAFFVYFPGPHGQSDSGRHLIPNFGDMRFIR